MREIRFRARFRRISNNKECWQQLILTQNHITSLDNLGGFLQITGWEQFTGLKDKNGKEIFEGDIVKLSNYKNQMQTMEIIGVVSKNFGAWGVVVKKNKAWKKYSCSPPEKDSYLYFLNLIYSKVYEIIGNIHQNKELLK